MVTPPLIGGGLDGPIRASPKSVAPAKPALELGPSDTLSGERAYHQPLVQRAQHLVDGRARPHVEERRLLQIQEPLVALRRADVPDDPVLVVDRRVLDVVVE